jgi:hypothetical protein
MKDKFKLLITTAMIFSANGADIPHELKNPAAYSYKNFHNMKKMISDVLNNNQDVRELLPEDALKKFENGEFEDAAQLKGVFLPFFKDMDTLNQIRSEQNAKFEEKKKELIEGFALMAQKEEEEIERIYRERQGDLRVLAEEKRKEHEEQERAIKELLGKNDEEMEEINKEKGKLNAIVQERMKQQKRIEDETRELNDELKSFQETIETIQKQISDLSHNSNALESGLANQTQTNQNLSQQIGELQNQFDKKTQQKKDLESQISLLDQQLNLQTQESDKQIKIIQQQIVESTKENNNLNEQITCLQNEVHNKTEEKAEIESSMLNLKSQLIETQETLTQFEEQLSNVKNLNTKKQKEIREQENILNDLTAKMEKVVGCAVSGLQILGAPIHYGESNTEITIQAFKKLVEDTLCKHDEAEKKLANVTANMSNSTPIDYGNTPLSNLLLMTSITRAEAGKIDSTEKLSETVDFMKKDNGFYMSQYLLNNIKCLDINDNIGSMNKKPINEYKAQAFKYLHDLEKQMENQNFENVVEMASELVKYEIKTKLKEVSNHQQTMIDCYNVLNQRSLGNKKTIVDPVVKVHVHLDNIIHEEDSNSIESWLDEVNQNDLFKDVNLMEEIEGYLKLVIAIKKFKEKDYKSILDFYTQYDKFINNINNIKKYIGSCQIDMANSMNTKDFALTTYSRIDFLECKKEDLLNRLYQYKNTNFLMKNEIGEAERGYFTGIEDFMTDLIKNNLLDKFYDILKENKQ